MPRRRRAATASTENGTSTSRATERVMADGTSEMPVLVDSALAEDKE
jgi:hypothetical protein